MNDDKPTTIVIFGASGDLTHRKLMPALYNNFRKKRLLDALKGDASLFARNDGIEAAWRLIDPILSGWESAPQSSPLHTYTRNSWGPEAADELLAKGGHAWRMGCCGLPCS